MARAIELKLWLIVFMLSVEMGIPAERQTFAKMNGVRSHPDSVREIDRLDAESYDSGLYLTMSDICGCAALNLDGVSRVDPNDLAILVDHWLSTQPGLPADINDDGIVNIKDFALLAAQWLGCTAPLAEAGTDLTAFLEDVIQVDGSGSSDPDGAPLTYQWSFISRPPSSTASLSDPAAVNPFFTADVAGTYVLQLVVQDDCLESAPDTLSVAVGDTMASLPIDSAGDTLELNRFELFIPPNVLSDPIETIVKELPLQADGQPSQAAEVAQDLDELRFQPMGPAYRFEAPFLADRPMTLTLAYEGSEIPEGFAPENLAVLVRMEAIGDVVGEEEDPVGWAVLFSPLPSQVDQQNHEVSIDVFGPGTFQVVAQAEPLEVYEAGAGGMGESQITPATEPGADLLLQTLPTCPSSPKPPTVVWVDPAPAQWQPGEKDQYSQRIVNALDCAFQQFVVGQGFTDPNKPPTVLLKKTQKYAAFFCPGSFEITLNPYKIPPDYSAPVETIVVHEYFHSLQSWSSNLAHLLTVDPELAVQVHEDNKWFVEGTAVWAQDEVYDDCSTGHYHAPVGKRFTYPLNISKTTRSRDPYEVAAFWKWLETKHQGAIRTIIEHHQAVTHSSTNPVVKNTTPARYLDNLTAMYPNVDFLEFVTDALYWKDFETDEITNEKDLWGSQRLGSPLELPADLRTAQYTHELSPGGPGSSEDNKLTIPYTVLNHLSSSVFTVKSVGLAGQVHLEFEKPDDPNDQQLVGAVILRVDNDQTDLLDFHTAQEVTLSMCPGSEIVVIITDPRWQPPSASLSFASGNVHVWTDVDVVLDFEHLRIDDDWYHYWGNTVIEDGFTLFSPSGNIATWGTLSPNFRGDSTGIYISPGFVAELTALGSQTLDLVSVDLAEQCTYTVPHTWYMGVTGYKPDGSEVSTMIWAWDDECGYATFSLDSRFTNLVMVAFEDFSHPTRIHIDNITIRYSGCQ